MSVDASARIESASRARVFRVDARRADDATRRDAATATREVDRGRSRARRAANPSRRATRDDE